MFTDREIKFRAYSMNSCKMTDWEGIKSLNNLQKLMTLDHVKVMKFTGLQDAKGTDVYHGDYLNDIHDNKLLTWEVVWKDGCFGIRNVGTDGYVNHAEFYPINSLYFFKDRVVAGNVYQKYEY